MLAQYCVHALPCHLLVLIQLFCQLPQRGLELSHALLDQRVLLPHDAQQVRLHAHGLLLAPPNAVRRHRDIAN